MSSDRPVAITLFAFVLLLGIVLCPLGANANSFFKFPPVSPDELKMTSVPEAPGAPAVILYREVSRIDMNSSIEDNYLRIKILTEEGRKYADVEIPFDKSSETVETIKARTIRPDGSIVNFDGKVSEKTVLKGKGIRRFAKTFRLPDVQVGSIIEYYYTHTYPWFWNSQWILSQELFTKKAKFSLMEFTDFRDSYHIYFRWSWNSLPKGVTPPKEDPDHILRWEATDIPAFQPEEFMPPENQLKFPVDLIYSEERFQNKPSVYWEKGGKRWNENLERFLGKQKAMEEAVAQIVLPGDSPEVKLQKIYARVQHLRNTSFELDKTVQEKKRAKEKEARTAEDVWKLGYGEGGELTWLFLGLARAAGLDAHGVLVADRANYLFNPASMNSRQLDENVILVKLNGKDVYCDPGAAFMPLGLVPWSETAVAGLLLDKDGGKWVQTVTPESSVSRTERVAKLKLSPETGSLEGKLTVTFTGLDAAKMRVEENHVDDAGRKKYLEDKVRKDVPASIDLELVNKPDWSSSEAPLVAEFSFKVPGWATQAGRRVLLPVGLFAAGEKHVFEHSTRVHPIYFDYPSQKLDDVTIELPPGWQVSSLPQSRAVDGHVIAYSLEVEKNRTSIHLARKFSVDFIWMESKHYSELQSFFTAMRTGDDQQIVLQPDAAVASK
jgi:hypothetical protein